jgi:DNA helicase-2/ATP-dependent DNA helicase PcrA
VARKPYRIANPNDASFYEGGPLLVEARPGAGKTTFLVSILAHRLKGPPTNRRAALVTYTNAAAQNAVERLKARLQDELGLDESAARALIDQRAWAGTIHGFARLILDYIAPAGSYEAYAQVAEESTSDSLLRNAIEVVIAEDRRRAAQAIELCASAMGLQQTRPLNPLQVENLWWRGRGNAFPAIKRAMQLAALGRLPALDTPLHQTLAAIYAAYDAEMRARGLISPDQIIAAALRAIEANPRQAREFAKGWECILEDEAQDSTPEQAAMLGALVRWVTKRSWVRVGDDNQSIMGSFTLSTARSLASNLPQIRFKRAIMPHSPRSTQQIIDLANALAAWCSANHPVEAVRTASLSTQPPIEPAPNGGNPEPSTHVPPISISRVIPKDAEKTAFDVVTSWLSDLLLTEPSARLGLLVRRNAVGFRYAQYLTERRHKDAAWLLPHLRFDLRADVDMVNLGQRLAMVMGLGSPDLSTEDIRAGFAAIDMEVNAAQVAKALANQAAELTERDQQALAIIAELRRVACLFIEDYGLYVLQRFFSNKQGYFGMLRDILASHRQGRPFVDPSSLKEVFKDWYSIVDKLPRSDRYRTHEAERGTVTVTTVHKAKGQEYDYVALLYADEASFETTARQPEDHAACFDLALRAIERTGQHDLPSAIQTAQAESLAEAARLLYVGVTRARKAVTFVVAPPLREEQTTATYASSRLTRLLTDILQTSEVRKSDKVWTYTCEVKPEYLHKKEEKTKNKLNFKEAILAALERGEQVKAIAQALGCSTRTVYYWRKRMQGKGLAIGM